ncbi:MAG: hypothetical protein EA352_06245 [Gemmatimonadales bacterium]|nr:MAG: hypothetical protein EA352_06245 [Gemmatimonadales bacterium]
MWVLHAGVCVAFVPLPGIDTGHDPPSNRSTVRTSPARCPEGSTMKSSKRSAEPQGFWAYGYEFDPPIRRDRTGPMEALLEAGHNRALLARGVWEGRLINGDDITHILVVSDGPSQTLEVNHMLEAELRRLQAPFQVTLPVLIAGGGSPGPNSPGLPLKEA